MTIYMGGGDGDTHLVTQSTGTFVINHVISVNIRLSNELASRLI